MNFFNKFNNLKNKNFKTNITKILSITTFGLLFIIMGFSYGYLTTSSKGSLINTVSSGNLELSLNNETSTLSLNKAVPQLDDDALESNSEYTFTLSNTGDVLTHYEIYLNNICSTSDSYIVNETAIVPDLCVDEKYINIGVKVDDEDYTIINFENDKATLDMGEIWPNEEKNYIVKIWLDVDTPNEYNSYLNGVERNVLFVSNINITGEQREYRDKSTIYNTIKKEMKNSNISYKYINNANVTENGFTYNNNDNGVFLYNGTDDNGGSLPIYYYRGNVANNNVIFGGFCWKIVRTTSTGGTKLIYNGIPTNGTCNNTGTNSQLEETSKFNENYNSPADIGYMYGARYTYVKKDMSSITDTYMYGNDVTYDNGIYTLVTTTTSTSWSNDRTTLADGYHYTCFNSTGICDEVYYITYFGNSSNVYYLAFTGGDDLELVKTKMFSNDNNSKVKENIDTWFNNNLINYTKYLENTIFCNDRSFAGGNEGGSLASKNINSIKYSYFAAVERRSTTYSPSLQCTNINDRFSLKEVYGGTDGYGNNTLIYPVGLLTSDEVILSGGQNTSNTSYYLHTGNGYWVISPYSWDDYDADGYSVYSNGVLTWYDVEAKNGIRPVISLKQDTLILEGAGLSNDPYVITK